MGTSNLMPELLYREAQASDIPQMAQIRAGDWGTEEYWRTRIGQYLGNELHPQHALKPRVAFVAEEGDRVVGLIAGHLTRRFGCDGELEWIFIRPELRKSGVGSQLFHCLAQWFVVQNARKICVDVEPTNYPARRFYARHGAEDLKPHWMVWKDIGEAVGPPKTPGDLS